MSESFDVIIIGNSAAGLQALRTIRRHTRSATVAVIDREAVPAYSRVLTPYYIGGKTTRDGLFIAGMSWYEKMGATTFFGRTAMSIDPERLEVELDDGKRLRFGNLLLATGAEARQAERARGRICTLRHLADADRLRTLMEKARSITAVGAGLVSVPLLSHAGTGVERNLVMASDRVFSRVVDQESSEVIEETFRKADVNIHRGVEVAVSVDTGDGVDITLTSGKALRSNLLLVGKGVVPNTSLATAAGLEVRTGITIDSYCRTTHPNIFAAGDAAEGSDFITGEPTVQGNWPTAVEQGETAALNMIGFRCRYDGSLKNNITEVFGLDIAVVGTTGNEHRSVSSHDRFTGRFRKLFLDEAGRLIGAVLLGETNDAGTYHGLIRRRERLPANLPTGTNSHALIMARL